MSGSDDREEIRREHISREQEREARKADEDYDARHRQIDAGFLDLAEADWKVRQARERAESGSNQVAKDVVRCETEIAHLLRQLTKLPDEPPSKGDSSSGPAYRKLLLDLLGPSRAQIRSEAEKWSERFDEIRYASYPRSLTSGTAAPVESVKELKADVERFRGLLQLGLGTPTRPSSVPAEALDLLDALVAELDKLYAICRRNQKDRRY